MTTATKQARTPEGFAYFPPEDPRKLLADYQRLRASHETLVADKAALVKALHTIRNHGAGSNVAESMRAIARAALAAAGEKS